MTAALGEYALAGALLAAAGAILAALVGLRLGSAGPLQLARWLLGGYTLLLAVASLALVSGLIDSDFSIAYVAEYTEKALPIGYKLAAFWAGQEGSLLLWALMLGVVSTIAAAQWRRRNETQDAVALAVLGGVCGFFAALLLIAANPFQVAFPVPADGHGLNPLLQDPWMIAHPPMLFLGYAGFAVPFAVLIGVLAAGTKDNQWVLGVRRWLLVSWLFLGVGILMGAKWAYIELGWGGYWAWDPVENASLLPWLIATALLHPLVLQQQRGMFKRWNAALLAVTFLLCIFGTYLTRSGVVQSVHAFGGSLVATFFLVFLVALVLLAAGLIAWRFQSLRSEQSIESLFSREAAFLATLILLTLMMLLTLLGTIFPLIGGLFTGQPISVNANFYNKVVSPLGLAVVALMACGPALASGKDAGERLARGLVLPAIGAAAAVPVAILLGLRNSWALLSVAVIVLAVLTTFADLVRAIWVRVTRKQENAAAAVLRLLDTNHRRYGGQLAHLGIAMILAGVVGSSLFITEQKLQLARGQSASVGPYTVTLQQLREDRHANFNAVEAQVLLSRPGSPTITLAPQKRYFDKADKPEQAATEVALESSLTRDVYVTLEGWEEGGEVVALHVIINPLVAWIWIGGLVMTLGGLVCILPPLLARPSAIPQFGTTEATPAAAAGAPGTPDATSKRPGKRFANNTQTQPAVNRG